MEPSPRSRVAVDRLRRLRPLAFLALGGVTLYVLVPSLLAVFGSWRSLAHLDWPFAVLALGAEGASFVCLWELDRIALHTRPWLPVIVAQLTGNAAGRVFPGGGATAAAVSVSVLRQEGVDTSEAAAAFATSTLLQLATTFALPVLALPAIVGGAQVDRSLATAAYLGAAVFVLLLLAGAVVLATDRPLALVGRTTQRLLNSTVWRHRPVTDLPQRLLAARDFVRTTLGDRWKGALLAAVGNTGFDYLALLAALRAVGASPRPSLVLLAYTAAEVLALVPATPGGLGFVEAGLVGTLRLAGVAAGDALTATLLYRIVAFWLPLPAGGVAYVLFRRHYRARQ
jgi:uncharacterized protein (TIRG00374 family)